MGRSMYFGGEKPVFWETEEGLVEGVGKKGFLSFLEGGQGFPDQFAFGEALKGEAGDVDGRLFPEDQLGHDLSHRRAVLEAVAAESVGQEEAL